MITIEVIPTSRSINEQIDYLNDKIRCYVAPSKIHGIGVFALRNLKAGENLYLFPENQERTWFIVPYSRFKDLYPDVRNIILMRWPSVINGSAFLAPNDDIWMGSFVNYSPDYNYDQRKDLMIKDVIKDGEILEDYCYMNNADKIYPNLCR